MGDKSFIPIQGMVEVEDDNNGDLSDLHILEDDVPTSFISIVDKVLATSPISFVVAKINFRRPEVVPANLY